MKPAPFDVSSAQRSYYDRRDAVLDIPASLMSVRETVMLIDLPSVDEFTPEELTWLEAIEFRKSVMA